MKISSKTLTTCAITEGGREITLNMIDDTGAPVALQVPFEQAQSLAMTLPQLLSHAVRSISGDPDTRYVYPLGEWVVEIPNGPDSLILTLKTTDGFGVSFGLTAAACRSLSTTIAKGAKDDDATADKAAGAPPRVH